MPPEAEAPVYSFGSREPEAADLCRLVASTKDLSTAGKAEAAQALNAVAELADRILAPSEALSGPAVAHAVKAASYELLDRLPGAAEAIVVRLLAPEWWACIQSPALDALDALDALAAAIREDPKVLAAAIHLAHELKVNNEVGHREVIEALASLVAQA